MQINEMKVGEKGRIIRIQSGGTLYRHRLISMGLLPGTEFCLSRIAPLGDPIEMIIRGFSLSLRKHEARILEVVKVTS